MLVIHRTLRFLRTVSLLTRRLFWRQRGVVLRCLAAWVVGLIFLSADQNNDFDLRLQIRAPQGHDKQIVLVLLPRQQWARLQGQSLNYFRPLKEASYFSDSFFWNANLWENLLKEILTNHPLVVGVGIYFGENIPRPPDDVLLSPVFSDPKIVWSTQLDTEGRILTSRFARTYGRNAGMNEISLDRDGIVRRFSYSGKPIPHIALQLAKALPSRDLDTAIPMGGSSPVVNFRGAAGTFSSITGEDVLRGRYPDNFFRNKIVIIGAQDSEGQILQTPLGPMPRAEILANVVDNIHFDRWFGQLNFFSSAVLLLVFVIFTAAVTTYYPQLLALFVLVLSQVIYATLSIWLFDQYYFWIPVLATFVTVFATSIIFMSFQLTMKDYVNLQLEKERQFLIDVEQLKNNFLSLISHDLKTPIAKIQGICDRLLTEGEKMPYASDLTALRVEASELHRYIHTILQITRVESRDFRINKDASDINELIDIVIRRLQPLANNKKITLSAVLEPMFLIEVDPVLISEVILNLVENAIKYTPDGGGVVITSREIDDNVLVMVEDNGPGISKDEQKRIFDKFFRGEQGRNQPKGSGLGLYLVKYFIEIHNGQVFLESELGKGTKVGFRLPITLAEES